MLLDLFLRQPLLEEIMGPLVSCDVWVFGPWRPCLDGKPHDFPEPISEVLVKALYCPINLMVVKVEDTPK